MWIKYVGLQQSCAILQLHFIQSPFPNQFRFGLDKTFLSQFSGTVNGKSQLCIFV